MKNKKLPQTKKPFNSLQNNRMFSIFIRQTGKRLTVLGLVFVLYYSLALPLPFMEKVNILPHNVSPFKTASATSVYHTFAGGALSFNISASTANMITANDDWTGVPSVEGFKGRGLTTTSGVDPQTVLEVETSRGTNVIANSNNPSAHNNGGVAEYDEAPTYSLGLQGNVQSNPYVVFYLNTSGRINATINYDIVDIDSGSNNSVSPVALQYRIGETGSFTNVPAGFVADATDGPNASGRVTSHSVILPAACNNQPQLQVRLLTTDANGQDEWIGINNVSMNAFAPTAATASVGGRVFSPFGRPLANAVIQMSDSSSNVRLERTNPFGYYQFNDVEVGQTYILGVRSKRYVFSQSTQIITVQESLDSVNFYADPLTEFYDYSLFGKKHN